jgi:protein SCO1/2
MIVQAIIKITAGIYILFLAACMSTPAKPKLPFYNTPDFTPEWISPRQGNQIHTIAAFRFTNQNGMTITNKEVAGKIYVANFFFTSCGSICPKMAANLKKVATHFNKQPNVLILSHSVLPEKDSVARLKIYAEKQDIHYKNWWLLTGDKEAIYTLARKSYFADEEIGYNRNSTEFLHTENAVLIDKGGRIRGVYNATLALEMNKLIEHIEILLHEQ